MFAVARLTWWCKCLGFPRPERKALLSDGVLTLTGLCMLYPSILLVKV